MRYFLVLVFSFLCLTYIEAQHSRIDSLWGTTPYSLRATFQPGKLIPTNDFVRGINNSSDTIDGYYALSLLFLKQTEGNKLWEQLYGYPVYGIGVYSAFFSETTEIGTPISVYGFFSGPFTRGNKWSFNYELGLGFAFNWKSFDPASNPNNIAIGAEQSVYIEAGLNFEYQLSKRYFLGLGYGLYHFSNGHLKVPNFGLNTQAIKLSMRYQINHSPVEFKTNIVPDFQKHYEWDISLYGGAQNVIYEGNDVDIITKYEGVYFPEWGLNNTISRKISYKSKIGAGFTVGYNGALNAQLAVENGELEGVDVPFGNQLTLSVYPSYELVVNRVSILLQPGFYLYRHKSAKLTPNIYQRVGIKYHFWKDYFAGISLRAYNYHVSDFIEWNIGRRIKW